MISTDCLPPEAPVDVTSKSKATPSFTTRSNYRSMMSTSKSTFGVSMDMLPLVSAEDCVAC